MKSRPCLPQREKMALSNKDPAQLKINKSLYTHTHIQNQTHIVSQDFKIPIRQSHHSFLNENLGDRASLDSTRDVENLDSFYILGTPLIIFNYSP